MPGRAEASNRESRGFNRRFRVRASKWAVADLDKSGCRTRVIPSSGARPGVTRQLDRPRPCQSDPERVARALFRGLPGYVWKAGGRSARRSQAKHAPVAQLDRASDYESEGRTFESFRARHFPDFLRSSHPMFVTRCPRRPIGGAHPFPSLAMLQPAASAAWICARSRLGGETAARFRNFVRLSRPPEWT